MCPQGEQGEHVKTGDTAIWDPHSKNREFVTFSFCIKCCRTNVTPCSML